MRLLPRRTIYKWAGILFLSSVVLAVHLMSNNEPLHEPNAKHQRNRHDNSDDSNFRFSATKIIVKTSLLQQELVIENKNLTLVDHAKPVSTTPISTTTTTGPPAKRHHKRLVSTRVWDLDVQKYWAMVRFTCSKEAGKMSSRIDGGPLNACPCIPDDLRGNITVDPRNLTWPEVHSSVHNTLPGGHWRPSDCAPRRRVAVIVPYRDRERHLRQFLANTHPILQRQRIEYRIFVVEQRLPYHFNKGVMMNIGFLEASKVFPMDCVLFHDVDMLMENDQNIVLCGVDPMHLGAYIDKFSYENKYSTLVGGAVSLTPKQFQKINGYSSEFYGWGGEDDNFSARVRTNRMRIIRGPREFLRYKMLHHERDLANKGKDGDKGFRYIPGSHRRDGLSTTRYKVVKLELKPLYTWIQADITSTNASDPIFSITGDFGEISGSCRAEQTDNKRLYLSVVTCQWLCQTTPSCVAIEYHNDVIEDSSCFMLAELCGDFTQVAANVTIYVKNRKKHFKLSKLFSWK